RNSDMSEQLILDYWRKCLQEIDCMAPPVARLLYEQVPGVNGNRITVTVGNELEEMTIKQKYASLIAQTYQDFGFQGITVDARINRNLSAEQNQQYEMFLKQKEQEDLERGMQALLEMEK